MVGWRRILLVDGNEELRTSVRNLLIGEDYEVTEAADAAGAAELLTFGWRFDLIVLDPEFPGEDGRRLCAELRRGGSKVPIIMLSENGTEDAVISGLDAGASDYVLKPFREAELLARLRAQLRARKMLEKAQLRAVRAPMIESLDSRVMGA